MTALFYFVKCVCACVCSTAPLQLCMLRTAQVQGNPHIVVYVRGSNSSVKGQRVKIIGFLSHRVKAKVTQKAARNITECGGWVLTELYIWTPKLESQIMFTLHEISFFF